MASSRLNRYQERKFTKRIFLSIAGMVFIVLFIFIFGLKILINFSLFVDKIRGTSKPINQTQTIIVQTPVLDWLPEATNSAITKLTGSGQSGDTVIIYTNNTEANNITVGEDNNFTIKDFKLSDGNNTIYAIQKDKNGNKSDKSNLITVMVNKKMPTLQISTPSGDVTNINGDNNLFALSGKTEAENSVTVNDRIAPVDGNGIFNYTYPLNDGDNNLSIIATNPAGNTIKVDKKIIYHR
jgi:hypothetical protein